MYKRQPWNDHWELLRLTYEDDLPTFGTGEEYESGYTLSHFFQAIGFNFSEVGQAQWKAARRIELRFESLEDRIRRLGDELRSRMKHERNLRELDSRNLLKEIRLLQFCILLLALLGAAYWWMTQ